MYISPSCHLCWAAEDEKELLPAGVHEFPFAFNLPPNLPPSFNSDKGFIVYTAIAILDRPAAANLVQKAGFSLHSILDLNLYSQATVSQFLMNLMIYASLDLFVTTKCYSCIKNCKYEQLYLVCVTLLKGTAIAISSNTLAEADQQGA